MPKDVEDQIAKLRATDDTRPSFWLCLTRGELYALLAGYVPESVKLAAYEVSDTAFEERLQRNALKPIAKGQSHADTRVPRRKSATHSREV